MHPVPGAISPCQRTEHGVNYIFLITAHFPLENEKPKLTCPVKMITEQSITHLLLRQINRLLIVVHCGDF